MALGNSTLAAALAAALIATGGGTALADDGKPPPQIAAVSLGNWAYDGANGPDAWGGICESGKRQSPINIEQADPVRLAPLTVAYKLSLIELKADEHGVTAKYGNGSHIEIRGETFELTGLSLHAPSEHTVLGRRFPIEIQFHHRSGVGRRAVISVFAVLGRENLAAREIVERLPVETGGSIAEPKVLMNARDLLPDSDRFFRYTGSLSTPPCTEDVDWFVMAEPLRLSEKQLSRLRGAIGKNARPVQPRNGRYLLHGTGG